MKLRWLGRMGYDEAHALQVQIRDAIIDGRGENTLLLVEHDPVITFGRRGPGQDLLVDEAEITQRGIALRQSERGGQTTYHGPGQLVGYVIARLHDLAPDVPTYVWRLEEAMIRTVATFAVAAERCHCGHGVFVDERKLGFIGIAVSRGVCWHGVALNVSTDLSAFELIRPCGLDVEVTSIHQYVEPPTLDAVGGLLAQNLQSIVTEDEALPLSTPQTML